MGDPRVQERDNPLVRRLNAVAAINAELGTAAGGGSRPPRPADGPVQGGRATVLPPPARPLTAEEAMGDTLPPKEQAELERMWAEDPSNPANRARQTAREYVAEHPTAMATILAAAAPDAGRIAERDYIGIIGSLPITEEQKQQLRLWIFEGAAKEMMLETARRMDALQVAFGLAPAPASAPKEEKSERGVETPVASEEPAASPRVRRKKGTTVARRRTRSKAQGKPTT